MCTPSKRCYFINFLNDLSAFNLTPISQVAPDPSNSAWLINGSNVKDTIQNQLDSTVDAPDIYAKLEWLAKYWNRVIINNRDDGDLFLKRVVLPGEINPNPIPFRHT